MTRLRRLLLKPYHYFWALGSAIWYGFPAKRLVVIGVTGTKGKSSVAEMLHAVLQGVGHKTALAGTIRFAIGEESRPNLFKMTLPGRGFIQKFLAEAVKKGATHAVVEITSEATLQYRHLFLDPDALIFTNLEPEHIESHGSLENYFAAKFAIGKALARSAKRPRAMIANSETSYGKRFLTLPVENKISFSFDEIGAPDIRDDGVNFIYDGTTFSLPQPGRFSVMNALAVIKTADWLEIPREKTAEALANIKRIAGRAERIESGQDFAVVVDYAHTPESLRALYDAFKNRRKICVLGNTGGGRDTWKRPLMGKIAEEYCAEIILTDEDPYDESPEKITDAMASEMRQKPTVVMDRREAIRAALRGARSGDAVLITGKGTDPFIMGPKGSKVEWSDARVTREEIEKLLGTMAA